jgi:hypothetical protein
VENGITVLFKFLERKYRVCTPPGTPQKTMIDWEHSFPATVVSSLSGPLTKLLVLHAMKYFNNEHSTSTLTCHPGTWQNFEYY